MENRQKIENLNHAVCTLLLTSLIPPTPPEASMVHINAGGSQRSVAGMAYTAPSSHALTYAMVPGKPVYFLMQDSGREVLKAVPKDPFLYDKPSSMFDRAPAL